jgi:hypothetical protein
MYYYDDDGSGEKREGEREFISNYNEEKKKWLKQVPVVS